MRTIPPTKLVLLRCRGKRRFPVSSIRTVAEHYIWAVRLLTLALTMAVAGSAIAVLLIKSNSGHSSTDADQRVLVMLTTPFAFLSLVPGLWSMAAVWQLSRAVGLKPRLAYWLLVPMANLFFAFCLLMRANCLCKSHGIRVGLLGMADDSI